MHEPQVSSLAVASLTTVPGWRRRALLAGGLGLLAWPASAHNNPTFKEVGVLAIDVAAAPRDETGAYSEPFEIVPPKRTVELVWRIPTAAPGELRFALMQGDQVIADDLANGATSRVVRGPGFTIARVRQADTAFRLELFATLAQWQHSS